MIHSGISIALREMPRGDHRNAKCEYGERFRRDIRALKKQLCEVPYGTICSGRCVRLDCADGTQVSTDALCFPRRIQNSVLQPFDLFFVLQLHSLASVIGKCGPFELEPPCRKCKASSTNFLLPDLKPVAFFDRRFKDFAADKSAQKRRADIAHTISTAIFSTFEHIAKFDQMVLPARICEQLESALECKAANPGLFLSRAAKALSQLSDINRRMFFNLLLIIRRVAEAGSDKAVQLGMICRFAVPCVFEKRDKMDANGNISWPKQEAIIAALASGLGDLVATLKIIDSGVDLGMDACCEPVGHECAPSASDSSDVTTESLEAKHVASPSGDVAVEMGELAPSESGHSNDQERGISHIVLDILHDSEAAIQTVQADPEMQVASPAVVIPREAESVAAVPHDTVGTSTRVRRRRDDDLATLVGVERSERMSLDEVDDSAIPASVHPDTRNWTRKTLDILKTHIIRIGFMPIRILTSCTSIREV